ncbi:Fc.00g114460.m01.CDS01 [Cosmosporella sp. VM-42]
MSLNSLLQVTLLAVAGLPQLVAAGVDAYMAGVQQPPVPPNFPQMDVIEGVLMDDCGDNISVCGKTADIRIVYEHAVTSYETNYKIFETVTTLPAETVVVTKVEFITTTTTTEGQCRSTTTIVNEKPLIITVDVNVTSTREFVPVTTSTTVSTSTVSEKAIEQCIIKTKLVTVPPPMEANLPPREDIPPHREDNPPPVQPSVADDGEVYLDASGKPYKGGDWVGPVPGRADEDGSSYDPFSDNYV